MITADINSLKNGFSFQEFSAIECLLSSFRASSSLRISLHALQTNLDQMPFSRRLLTLSVFNQTKWKDLASSKFNTKEIPLAQMMEIFSLDLRNFSEPISTGDLTKKVAFSQDFAKKQTSHFQADPEKVVINNPRLVFTILGHEIDLISFLSITDLSINQGVFISLLLVPFRGKFNFIFLILVYENGIQNNLDRILFAQINDTFYLQKPFRIRRDLSIFWPNQYTQANLFFTLGNNSKLMSKKESVSTYIHRSQSFFEEYNTVNTEMIIEENQETIFSLNDVFISENNMIISGSDLLSSQITDCLWIDLFNNRCLLCSSNYLLDIDGKCVSSDSLPQGNLN